MPITRNDRRFPADLLQQKRGRHDLTIVHFRNGFKRVGPLQNGLIQRIYGEIGMFVDDSPNLRYRQRRLASLDDEQHFCDDDGGQHEFTCWIV